MQQLKKAYHNIVIEEKIITCENEFINSTVDVVEQNNRLTHDIFD